MIAWLATALCIAAQQQESVPPSREDLGALTQQVCEALSRHELEVRALSAKWRRTRRPCPALAAYPSLIHEQSFLAPSDCRLAWSAQGVRAEFETALGRLDALEGSLALLTLVASDGERRYSITDFDGDRSCSIEPACAGATPDIVALLQDHDFLRLAGWLAPRCESGRLGPPRSEALAALEQGAHLEWRGENVRIELRGVEQTISWLLAPEFGWAVVQRDVERAAAPAERARMSDHAPVDETSLVWLPRRAEVEWRQYYGQPATPAAEALFVDEFALTELGRHGPCENELVLAELDVGDLISDYTLDETAADPTAHVLYEYPASNDELERALAEHVKPRRRIDIGWLEGAAAGLLIALWTGRRRRSNA